MTYSLLSLCFQVINKMNNSQNINKNKVKYYIVFILGLFSSFIFCQGDTGKTDSLDLDENVSIVHYQLDGVSPRINDIEIDPSNRVLVATSSMIFVINSTNERPRTYLEGTDVQCVTSDPNGKIFAGSGNILYLVHDAQSKKLEGNVHIKDLVYQDGKIWIATENGLYSYSIKGNSFKRYDVMNSKLKTNKINFVDVDDHNILWIGTGRGYVRIKEGKWEVRDKRFDIIKSRSNKEGQWMVTAEDMWLIDPYNRKYDVGLSKDFYSGKLNDFVIDSRGRIYFASDELVRYNPYNEKVEHYGEDLGLISQKCITLACDKNNNIWIGTADAGLFRILFDDISQEQLNAVALIKHGVDCYGEKSGAISVKVSGGVKPYKYQWDNKNLSGPQPNGLKAGKYTVTVTDKFGGNFVTEITLTEPEPLHIKTDSIHRISDVGKSDGIAIVSATGGTGALNYLWSNGTKGQVLKNAKPGKYTVTVTDENGCKVSHDVIINKEKYIPELDISKVNVGQTLRINKLTFDADSTVLNPENFEILDEVYDFLVKNPDVVVEIGGHTNTIPPHSYCDKLSTARAKSVADYIINKGISKSRVAYKGYGKRQPLTTSKSAVARKKNQRVEIKILSIGKG